MDKKEARKILCVSKETSRNDIERKFSILLKKKRLVKERSANEAEQDAEVSQETEVSQNTGVSQDTKADLHVVAEQGAGVSQGTGDKHEEYSFEQITQAYNILMGYEVPFKEEPPSKAAPLLRKAGIDEKKAQNFFYYYKYHILVIIVTIVSIVFIVRGCVNRVDPDFTTAFIGEISYSDTDKLKELIKANIPEIKEPGFDGAFVSKDDQSDQQYAMVMKATVLFAAGDVDVFILDKSNFERYAKQGAFMSLDEIVPELGIDLEKNKEYIVKVDNSEDESGETSGDTSGDNAVNEPAVAHLYGIDISGSTAFNEAGVIGNEMIAAFSIRGKQQDKAMKLLQFLMK